MRSWANFVVPDGVLESTLRNLYEMSMNVFPWKEKRLRTVWKVGKDGKASFLVGTAHFSPFSFRKTLTRLIRGAETVLFEGPLDRESMASVARYGNRGEGAPSVYEALDPALIREINRQLADRLGPATAAVPYLDLLHVKPPGFLEEHARGVRAWMAFFTTWAAFLNWKHSIDLEAFQIARKLGKSIEYLETIEDQLKALDGIPFDRIVNYFNKFYQWGAHRDLFTKVFLEGKPQHFLSLTGEFPTRCESIIGKRDPIFFNGIRSSFETRPTAAFVGVAHIPGILKRFLDEGYQANQQSP